MLVSFLIFANANALQDAIDKAPEGAILKLPKGVYRGRIVINKPLTIVGKEAGAVIDGEGEGSVITVTSSYVTLKTYALPTQEA